jgi:aspartate aminotransferase
VVYPEQAIAALGRLLTEKAAQYGHPIYIISDEPYRELCYDGITPPFIPGIYADTIVCYSYSKSLSLPGERIGYVYVGSKATDAKALLAAVAGAARALGHVCAPALMQKLIARCADLRPDLQAYDNNRKALYEGLLALGYEMPRPQGAFYLFVKAPGGDANSFSQKAKALDLLVVPGDGFGCPGYFRLCYCVAPQTIARSLSLFARLIEDFHH